MEKLILSVILTTSLLGFNALAKGPNARPVSWADCEKFDGLVAPNVLPAKGNFDQLYMMEGATFKDGVPLISESKPGDQDYNGGRWHVNVLKEGIDPAKYNEACSVDDLDLGDFEGTGVMFNCPLLTRRRNN